MTTTMSATIRANVEVLINLGFSVEDAVRLATKAANPTVTATAVEPKAQPKTTEKPKASKPATKKAEPKAPTTKQTTAKATEKPKASKPVNTAREASKSIDGKAVMANTKFKVEKTVRTDNGAECYRITLAEGQDRLGKAEWYAVTKLFGEELYASYYRGAWSTPVNPTQFLSGKGLTKAQTAVVTAAKAARAKARESAKKTA